MAKAHRKSFLQCKSILLLIVLSIYGEFVIFFLAVISLTLLATISISISIPFPMIAEAKGGIVDDTCAHPCPGIDRVEFTPASDIEKKIYIPLPFWFTQTKFNPEETQPSGSNKEHYQFSNNPNNSPHVSTQQQRAYAPVSNEVQAQQDANIVSPISYWFSQALGPSAQYEMPINIEFNVQKDNPTQVPISTVMPIGQVIDTLYGSNFDF